jgi:hypothetical protein
MKNSQLLGVVVHISNPNTLEAETGGFKVQDHSGIHNEKPKE